MDQKKGTTVQETASLHEKAVQAIASGEVDPTPAKERKKPEKRSGELRHIKVTPAVWVKAQEVLSNGHGYTKIEVIDEQTVMVR
jgi:hypothetical protein